MEETQQQISYCVRKVAPFVGVVTRDIPSVHPD